MAGHDAIDQSLLLALPDDVLVAVLAYLPPRELFRCRLLCRRLRDLCLHRDLWRRVCLPAQERGVVRAALLLAPCVRHVHSDTLGLEALASLVAGTTCVVKELTVSVGSAPDVALATPLIEKLSSLGGLRKLWVSFADTPVATASPLLQVIYSVSDLRELNIWINSDASMPIAWCDVKQKPSLTLLSYTSPTMDPFLHLMLQTHAATLEKVYLNKVWKMPEPASNAVPGQSDFPLTLLNAIPRLRALCCFPNDGLSQLQAGDALKELSFTGIHREGFPAGALEFIRKATQLQVVNIDLPYEDPSGPVQALAESCSAPRLEHLFLRSTHGSNALDVLAAALPRFPALQTLGVASTPPDSLLRAVSPAALPRLSMFRVCCFETCAHAWLHDPFVQDVLVRNPQLHLRIEVSAAPVLEDCPCPWCRWGCHKELAQRPSSLWSFFSAHRKKADCPRDCFQVALPPCPSCERPSAQPVV
ncbi:F-box/LRR-repeat protein 12-like isoform X2 [Thrips palmi]|nr:F-box/LRR-repeat protein 12-like isoform X2 [Thrips palmi]XP_034248612.1 F-box/LRR-repeat protein 12-like isoform X2 [Thrips palmi]XP_034248613.1 F-box/LRR-repeat protein 12-like isoform X2 [Thrips palmi]XP_034248614.1 F-box/LRR-repeat protein 12-like isoform X2 [Thrips palmi]XP_034248615.1 F-box/LRR-repeat protein 12-like isoform X2 [Thrips palmi]XP_034248616.1 F-box/LRR-repeat protein 12-like isoform X2 [Thrips palmi]XP_034248617.1 F-box/LRR-repeat protein 12-like isoform X2 [Thrips palm